MTKTKTNTGGITGLTSRTIHVVRGDIPRGIARRAMCGRRVTTRWYEVTAEHEVCRHCGCKRTTDTWAQNRETGEQGLREVSYEENAFTAEELASAEWD